MSAAASDSRPVALVTGAARRLGREIALELARGGHDIAVHYRHSRSDAEATQADIERLGARCEVFAADLANGEDCEALVPAVLLRLGRLDAVVNNASMFEHDDVASFSAGALERHLRANTAAPVLLARALHEHVTAHGARGCVVNLSDQKLWNLNPDYFSYTLSKAALDAATQMLALALAPQVRVCAVAPGVTLVSGPMDETEFSAAHRLTPLERSSTPTDIARAVRFLVESGAITGTTLLVDGGQHLARQPRDVLFLARDALNPKA
jgi:NAD(P)-dependent dehydrogenase (short-subunit alcohol dehydrogenase family)